MVSCCIDKTSSAELTEAINSMFRWYRNSTVCYAYLADVSASKSTSVVLKDVVVKQLEHSRWFRRGWTLQELIAPSNVVFYSKYWNRLGTKSGLSSIISSITKIQQPFLNSENLPSASIAQKMSWASHRETSRPEDMAYCLLGIFDVNMPLIYGEGKNAFQRLQDEIMDAYPHDFTIFAWGNVVSEYSREVTDRKVIFGDKPFDSGLLDKGDDDTLGLLAKSPRDFENSSEFVPAPDSEGFFDIEIPIRSRARIMLRLKLPLLLPYRYALLRRPDPLGPQIQMIQFTILPCGRGSDTFFYVVIPLLVTQIGFGLNTRRLREVVINKCFTRDQFSCLELKNLQHSCSVASLTHRTNPEAGDILLKRIWTSKSYRWQVDRHVNWYRGENILRRYKTHNVMKNLFAMAIAKDRVRSFLIVIQAYPGVTVTSPNLHVSLYDTDQPAKIFDEDWDTGLLYQQEMTPYSPYTPIIDLGPSQKARIGVERVFLDDDPARPVDILDIIVADRKMAPHWWLEPLVLSGDQPEDKPSEGKSRHVFEADGGSAPVALFRRLNEESRHSQQGQIATLL